jgi:hypothetical protein
MEHSRKAGEFEALAENGGDLPRSGKPLAWFFDCSVAEFQKP